MWKHKGFTFIELILVLMIIGILTSIAYPSYLNTITRARRHDGQTALLELANQMEQYYAINNTYLTATIASGNPSDIRTSNTSPEGWYTLAIIEQSDTNYTLQATANHIQAQHDEACKNLTLTSLGVKGASTNSDKPPHKVTTECW